MKKLIAKIVGIATAFAMAIGVGVVVANKEAKRVNADVSELSAFTFDFESDTAHRTSGNNSYTGSNIYKQLSNGDIVLTYADSTTTGSPISGNAHVIARVAKNTTNTPTVVIGPVDLSSYNITGISYFAKGVNTTTFTSSYSTNGSTWTQLETHTASSTATTYGNSTNLASTLSEPSSLYVKIEITVASSTGSNRDGNIDDIKFYGEGSGAPVVESVSVAGDMTVKSYTTVQQWNNSGLTASATMSDSSPYGGSFNWSYSPTTPAAYALSNGDEVTGGTVRATANASLVSGYKDVTGISVSYATVAQLTAATPETANEELPGVIAKGIVSQINEVNTQNGNATYFISDDGTTTGQYYVYRGKGVDNVSIANANDIQVGDVVVVYGAVTNYNGTTKEFKQGNYLLSLDRPASADPSITITEASFSMNVGDADVTVHETHENVPDGGSIAWVSNNPSVATVSEVGGDYKVHAVSAGSATITAKILNSSSEMVASNSITVTVFDQALADGDTFIIKANYNEATYYMTGVTSNLGTVSSNSAEAMIFTAIEGATPHQFQLKNSNNYLSYSGSSNNVYTVTDGEAASTFWTAITNGSSTVIESVNVPGRKLQFNYNGGNSRFACYTSVQTAIDIEDIAVPEVDSVTVVGNATADAHNTASVTADFNYEVAYVDPNNAGSGAVNVSVKNSSDGTEGASVTAGPANGEFTVTFTMSDTYTVTVTSAEDPSKSDSTEIVVSNIFVEDYKLYTNESMTEGDYIFYYDGAALNNVISSDRAQYDEVTPVSNVISTSNANIIWRVARSGEYWTIYNAAVNKYLASTGAKNKIQLLENGTDDQAKWSVTISENTYDFVNKKNTENSVNANLRKNGTYGFACYGSGTGGALSLYKLNAKSEIEKYLTTRATLSYSYTKDGNDFHYSDVKLRFGGFMSVELWNRLNELNILSYGVKFSPTGVTNLKDAVVDNTTVKDFHTDISNSHQNPTPVDKESTNDYYLWNLRWEIGESDLTSYYSAVAYIVTENGGTVYFRESRVSAASLAYDLLEDENQYGGSLFNLAGMLA